MIRINLLGQARPKASRRAVPLGAMIQVVFLATSVVAALGALWIHDVAISKDKDRTQDQIAKLQREKQRLESLKQQVEAFQKQKDFLQRRISVIEEGQGDTHGHIVSRIPMVRPVAGFFSLGSPDIRGRGDYSGFAGAKGPGCSRTTNPAAG